jgi:hypothetical protein
MSRRAPPAVRTGAPFALLAPASLIASLAACGGSADGGPASASGLDSPDRALAIQSEPVHAVGGMNAPEWATFGEIAAVRFDDDGRLYILDAQARVISVVGTDGEPVGTVGSAGEGPGELGWPMSFVVTPGGGVAVFDFGHQGFVVYDSTGAYVRNQRVDIQTVGVPGREMVSHPDGAVVAPITGTMRMGPDAEADTLSPHRPVVRLPLAAGAEPSLIYRAWDLPPAPQGDADMTGSGIRIRIPRERAFEPPLSLAVLPDGRIAVVDSVAYRIRLLDAAGVEQGMLERPVAPTQVTERIQEAERQRRLDEMAEGGGPRFMISTIDGGTREPDPEAVKAFMEERLATMLFADEIPVIERIAVDSEGRIWVQRSSGTPGRPGPTDVITAEGRYLGTFPPDGLRIPDAFGPDGLVARIETDEFDVPTVVVERLPAGWS